MTDSQIYFEAAERVFIAKTLYACNAIHSARFFASLTSDEPEKFSDITTDNEKLVAKFAKYFKPRGKGKDDIWWGKTSEDTEARVIALLLMSEIAKEND